MISLKCLAEHEFRETFKHLWTATAYNLCSLLKPEYHLRVLLDPHSICKKKLHLFAHCYLVIVI
jgi:hypothetical protein